VVPPSDVSREAAGRHNLSTHAGESIDEMVADVGTREQPAIPQVICRGRRPDAESVQYLLEIFGERKRIQRSGISMQCFARQQEFRCERSHEGEGAGALDSVRLV